MNTILKNFFIGIAVAGICFGIGYGMKWVSNHDWGHKSEEDAITRLERKLNYLESDIDRLTRQITRQNARIERLTLNQQIELSEKMRAKAYQSKIDSDDEDSDYQGRSCRSQAECGGKNSGYFCNYGGNHTKNVCEKTNAKTTRVDGILYYYNRSKDLNKWCRQATESADDRANPENCNWGYLSYYSAQAWCESIGKELLDPQTISDNCENFDFLPEANDDQQYWTSNMSVIHMGKNCSIQNMVRGDGYCYAGGVICK